MVTEVTIVKFYDRDEELNELQKLLTQSETSARMAVLTGRRRFGKTLLSLELVKGRKYLYFFVSKKSEAMLCEEYLREIKNSFKDIPILGDVRSFKDVFHLLLEISKREPFTVILDEFQEFYNVNPAVYSEMQKLWDLNKNKCRLNVIVIGSVYSLMHRIFQNSKEPLFNRADRILILKPFAIKIMAGILRDYGVRDSKILFDYYLFTGGSPKYVDLLVENGAFSLRAVVDFMVSAHSPFIEEGKNVLIEEFGKEYGTYFSILELISIGKTGRSEIESILESNVGGYLDRLEKDYSVIAKYKPINAKPNSRSQKYKIVDHFLNFWFRFIYRHRSAVETGNFDYIKDTLRRDYSTYSGRGLEQFYRDLLAETRQYNRIGSYWERGNQNEIDLVAVNDLEKEGVIAEVKINKRNVSLETLKRKSKHLIADFPGYRFQRLILGLEDIEHYL